jgi:hypothetical protein
MGMWERNAKWLKEEKNMGEGRRSEKGEQGRRRKGKEWKERREKEGN